MVVFTFIKRFILFVAGNFNEFLEKNGPYMAAAISFYSFLSLFPLLIAIIAIFSFLLGNIQIEQSIITALKQLIPVLNEVDDAFLAEFFLSLQTQQVVTSTLAIAGLLWASTAVFGAIRKSVNAIWGIRKTRPFLIERFMDFSLLFGTAFILIGSILFSLLLGFLQQILESILQTPTQPQFWQILAQLIPPALSFIGFTILYWWLPNISLSFRNVWPTAVAATIAFEISKQVFILYLRNLGGLANNVYGGVSSVIVLLAFVYVSAIIMLVGAMLTARYTVYLNRKKQTAWNNKLSTSLERIRSTPSLPGMPRNSPSGGASDAERARQTQPFQNNRKYL